MIFKKSFNGWIRNGKNWVKIIIPGMLLITLFIAGRFIDINEYLQTAQEWIWKLGPWGPLAFGSAYVLAMLFLLPGAPFSIIAALLFGTLWGYVIMLASTTIAAGLGFFFARYFMKDYVQSRLADMQVFEMVTAWVEKNPWLAIPFVRVMPFLPFSLNNYALGMTKVSFVRYIFASVLIFIPMTGVFILGANALYSAMVRGKISWELILGSMVAGIVILLLGLYGKKFFMAGENNEESGAQASRRANNGQ